MLGLLSGIKQTMVDVASKIVADDQDENTPAAQVEPAHVEFADVLITPAGSAHSLRTLCNKLHIWHVLGLVLLTRFDASTQGLTDVTFSAFPREKLDDSW